MNIFPSLCKRRILFVKKAFSLVMLFGLIVQPIAPSFFGSGFFIPTAHAQEETESIGANEAEAVDEPEEEAVEEATVPTETEETIVEISETTQAAATEEATNPETTEAETSTEIVVPAEEKSIWHTEGNKATTTGSVELGVKYEAPQNKSVTVTFTKLPNIPGTLTIEEITLSKEQVETLGATSDKAYDITSSMENGSFEYELTLPIPTGKGDVEVKYAEKVEELKDAQTVDASDVKTEGDSLKVELDHFTVFVVVDPNTQSNCDAVALGTTSGVTCFATIEVAVTAALPGDTIKLASGTHTLTSLITINKANLTIEGTGSTIIQGNIAVGANFFKVLANGFTLKNVELVKTDKAGQQDLIYIGASNVTIENNEIHGQFTIGDTDVSRAFLVQAGSFSGINITGNTIYSLRQPMYVSGTSTGTVSNNYTYLTKGWVLEGGNLTFTNNTWGTGTEANVYDIAILPAMSSIYYTDIVAMMNANNGAVIEDQRPAVDVLSAVYVDASTSFSSDLGGHYHPYSALTATAIARVVPGGTVYLETDVTTTAQVTIGKPLTLEGDGNTLNANFAKTDNSNNSGISIIGANGVILRDLVIEGVGGTNLHGINVYQSSNVSVENVTTRNNDRSGLVVNSSGVTVNNITTANNGWHGINVDYVTQHTELTVNGTSIHTGEPLNSLHIYVDNRTEDVAVNDINAQYSITEGVLQGNDRVYTLTPDTTAPAIPGMVYHENTVGDIIPTEGYTDAGQFTFNLSSDGDTTRYQLKYWNDIVGSSYKIGSPWNPSDLSGYSSSLGVYHDQFTQGEGKHYFAFSACDAANNCSAYSAPFAVTYDHAAPTVPVNGLPNGTFELDNDFDFTWDASTDNFPASITYEYQATLNPAQSGGVLTTGLWHSPSPLTSPMIHSSGAPDGVWYWQVRAKDGAGNTSAWSQIWSMTIDSIAPAVPTHLSPADNTFTTTAAQTSIDWSDVTDTNGSVTYQYQSSTSTNTNSDGSFVSPAYTSGTLANSEIPTPGTPEGVYYWHVRAKDASGHWSAWSTPWKITVDNTNPVQPVFTAPDNNLHTNVNFVTLTWTGGGDTGVSPSGIKGYTVRYSFVPMGGGATVNWTSGLIVAGNPQTHSGTYGHGEGTYTSYVSTTDNAGNVSPESAPLILNYDATLPTVVDLVFPTPGSAATSFQVVFSEDVNEAEVKNGANYFLNNWPGAGGSGDLAGDVSITYDSLTKTATIQMTNPGWYVSAEQEWGVQNISDLAGNLQAVNPYPEVSTPMVAPVTADSGTDANWHNAPVTVTLACDDGPSTIGSGCKTTYYTTNGSAPTIASAQGNTVGVSSEGVTTIKYFSIDNAGNTETVKSAANTVKIDTVLPESTITTFGLVDGGTINTPTWDGVVEGTATDTLSGVDHVNLSIKRNLFSTPAVNEYWNGATWQATDVKVAATGTTNWTYALPTPEEGIYTINSHAVDAAGNEESTYTITIVYDKTIPEVSLAINPVNPDGNNTWYTSEPVITLTANDNYNVDYIEYQLNGIAGSWTTYTGSVTLVDGTWQFYYRSVDTIGNVSGMGVKNVKVDTTDPDEVNNLDAEYRVAQDDIKLDWNVDDGDIDRVLIYRGSSNGFNVNSGNKIGENDDSDDTFNDGDVEFGETYYYKLVSVDEAGNHSGSNVIQVEMPAAPAPGATAGAATITPLGTEPVEEGTVLGEQTENNTNAPEGTSEEGQVAGVSTENGQVNGIMNFLKKNWWWLLILLFVLGYGSYQYSKAKKPNLFV